VACVSHRRIVDDALRALVAQARQRDVDGAVALFHDDGVLFGSEREENAVGRDELRAFFARLFEWPGTYGWSEWDPLLTGGSGSIVWFVAPATLVVRDDSNNDESFPYRVSGVLERAGDGQWRSGCSAARNRSLCPEVHARGAFSPSGRVVIAPAESEQRSRPIRSRVPRATVQAAGSRLNRPRRGGGRFAQVAGARGAGARPLDTSEVSEDSVNVTADGTDEHDT